MFSREESKRIREEFWIEFGKKFPRKWLLYNTKIKEIQLKFTFTTEFAQVSLDISSPDDLVREYYSEKLEALENVLRSDYLPEARLEKDYFLPEGKLITRIYVQRNSVNIHSKNHWPDTFEFLYKNMDQLESFFEDFRDYIQE